MSAFDIKPADGLGSRALAAWRTVKRPWSRFWRLVAFYMPKRMYGRSLLIVITPMILLQSVVAFVFMERHWQTVTQRLSTATVRDISAVIDMIETFPASDNYANVIRIAGDRLSLDVDIMPSATLPPAAPRPLFAILDQALSEEIEEKIARPFWIDTVNNSKIVEIQIQLDNKVLRVFASRSQTYASNTHIFLVWMVGTSVVLLLIAIPFLRNQVKPIMQLAEAAESFGKGRPLPSSFRPRGAEEGRRAGLAFNQMRERIERQIEQRTAMLTGVSHDLRTILTRFRLQLALGPRHLDSEALNKDVDDMQSMLEGYMAFAKGDTKENPGDFDLEDWAERVADEAELRNAKLTAAISGEPIVHVRPNAFGRLLGQDYRDPGGAYREPADGHHRR